MLPPRTDNVIPFKPRKTKEVAPTTVVETRDMKTVDRFLLCSLCLSQMERPPIGVDDLVGLLPIIRQDSKGVYISSLICLGCYREIAIVDGRPEVY